MFKLSRRLSWGLRIIVSAIAVALPHQLWATLAPKKPSDMVVLSAVTLVGPCPGGQGRLFSHRIGPDGNQTPFTIPQDHVLVLTGISWFSTNLGNDLGVAVTISLVSTTGLNQVYVDNTRTASA